MVSRPPNRFDLPRSPSDAILREISSRVSPQQFETWFWNIAMVVEGSERIVITTADNFRRAWIDRKFRDVIAVSARQVLGTTPWIEIVVAPGGPKLHGSPPLAQRLRSLPAGAPRGSHSDSASERPAPCRAAPNLLASSHIHESFTFDTLVVGPSNRLAHAAVLAVAEAPGRAYNPLCVNGLVGSGKTHHLHALFHQLRRTSVKRLTYLTSEAFATLLETAFQENALDSFRERIR